MKIFKELKKLGYKHYTEHTVEELDDLPLDSEERISEQALVLRWFREKYNILATIYSNASGYLYEWHDAVGGTHRGWSEYEGPNDSGVWDTYEEAELACLIKLIEIVKKK